MKAFIFNRIVVILLSGTSGGVGLAIGMVLFTNSLALYGCAFLAIALFNIYDIKSYYNELLKLTEVVEEKSECKGLRQPK